MAKTTTDPSKTVDPLSASVGASQQPGQFDLSKLTGMASKAAEATKVQDVDTTPISQFIKDYMGSEKDYLGRGKYGQVKLPNGQLVWPNDLTPELKPVAEAGLSDLQASLDAAKRQHGIQAQGAQTVAEATMSSLQQSRANVQNAKEGHKALVGKASDADKAATARKDEALAHNEKVYTDYINTIEKWSETPNDMLARQLEVASQSSLLSSRNMERQIKESIGAGWETDPLYLDFKLQEAAKFQTSADNLMIAASQNTQRMLELGASGAAGIATARVSTDAWAFKNEQDVHQANLALVETSRLQTLAFQDAQRALELTELKDFSAYLGSLPVIAVETAPLLATLLELQQTASAEKEADNPGYFVTRGGKTNFRG
ncbi:MAG: hypothetical protein GY934_22380 [Gammaproteobacteria bacterium]|nr:hypothetical protein [Gammaproteobacteria bacterium]